MFHPLAMRDWTPEYFTGNREECNEVLENLGNIEEIPLINNIPLHDLKDQQLVRFKGMVQDMYDPEYFFQQYEVKNLRTDTCDLRCGMYTDSAKCLPDEEILVDSNKNLTSERQTYVVISVPGLNSWAKEKYKRSCSVDTNATANNKRNVNESNCESADYSEMCKKGKITTALCNEREHKEGCTSRQPLVLSKEYILNFPVPMDDGRACIVKVYDNTSLKLNETIDVIGFVSLNPLLSIGHESDETMTEAEANVHHPPASLVPRLHAIKISHSVKHDIKAVPQIMSKLESIRSDFSLILRQLLFGDQLAADYLICHLLSSVYMRRDYICLGTYPLNITHFPVAKHKGFTKDLYKFLTLFTEKSHLLEITLDSLNDLTLSPKKDYECNRLNSGVLQLSDHTHLVIDETGLTTGQITQAARQNYHTLCDLVTFQKVSYDFQFYKMEYETDLPVLILSEAKSFIPCQTQVVLRADSESERIYPQIIEMTERYLKEEERLGNIRQYLRYVRDTKFEFNDEDVVKEIQNDFTRLKELDRNADRLHSLMVLARLLSLSYGSTTLTAEYWKKAVQMERERLCRLPRKEEI